MVLRKEGEGKVVRARFIAEAWLILRRADGSMGRSYGMADGEKRFECGRSTTT